MGRFHIPKWMKVFGQSFSLFTPSKIKVHEVKINVQPKFIILTHLSLKNSQSAKLTTGKLTSLGYVSFMYQVLWNL